jgi:hypothetical protein
MLLSLNISNMHPKYIIKRIKLLSNYINIDNKFKLFIAKFIDKRILISLYKTYSIKDRSYQDIKTWIVHIISSKNENISVNTIATDIKKVVSKNLNDLLKCNIFLSLYYHVYNDEYDADTLKSTIIENNSSILNQIVNNNSFNQYVKMCSSNPMIYNINKILMDHNLFKIYISNHMTTYNLRYILLTRFFVPSLKNYSILSYIVNCNLILHHLRLKAKWTYKINQTIHYVLNYSTILYINDIALNYKIQLLYWDNYTEDFKGPYLYINNNNIYTKIVPEINMISLQINAIYYNHTYYLIDAYDNKSPLYNYLDRYNYMSEYINTYHNWTKIPLLILHSYQEIESEHPICIYIDKNE